MHHPGASVLPAVLAIAERDDLDGRAVLEAAICGYEASLRIGLATQPAMFQRGFMATPTCGTLGAALAVAKLLKFNAQDMAGALGAASSYAGGLAQFYHSGSFIKRINGGRRRRIRRDGRTADPGRDLGAARYSRRRVRVFSRLRGEIRSGEGDLAIWARVSG
jgi:hypothetical protein